jgi:transposase
MRGEPYRKYEKGSATIGLDLGPSTIAIVADDPVEGFTARLLLFCADLNTSNAEIKRLQRKADRQRRANNPDNYLENGSFKPRSQQRPWVVSKRYQTTLDKVADLLRKQAAHRKSLHGELVNWICRRAAIVKFEDLSYKAWQKMWGKSIGHRAPGTFVSLLRTRCKHLGIGVVDIPTRTTALSQTCHGCGVRVKKTLRQRWHNCPECGVHAQRDLYSAWLAIHVERGLLDREQAIKAWPDVHKVLVAAMDDLLSESKLAKVPLPSTFGLRRKVA